MIDKGYICEFGLVDGDNTIEDNVEVAFYDRPVIKQPVEAIFVCEQDSLIDLTIKQTELLSLNASPEFYKVEYFETEEGALNNNKIPDPENYSVSRETILARIVNLESGCRYCCNSFRYSDASRSTFGGKL